VTPTATRRQRPRAGTLAGTGRLLRFLVRLDRVRLALWIAGIALLVWVSAVSVADLYPTQADLDKAAAALLDNAAVVALNGPTYGVDTLGGQIVFQIGSFGYITMALMGMFLVGRHTRGDEEEGRTELVRASVVGRNAPTTAALVAAGGGLVVVGALITLIMLSESLPLAGSLAYGAAMTAFGLLFACAMAVAAQVTEHTRTAYGLIGAALGVSYMVRAVGDIGSGAVSWLSPMGWAMNVRAFAGERWWPLPLLAGAAAALVAVTYWLAAHRDLGAGLVAPRPGPPRAAPGLLRPSGLAVRLQRAALAGWLAGLALSGVAYGAVAQNVGDLVGDNSNFEKLIAQGAAGGLTDAYLATSTLMLALGAGGFVIASVLRLRGEESSGRAELLLATALSRPRWALSHLGIAVVGSAVIMAATGIGTGLAYGLSISDLSQVPRLAAAALAFTPALWVLAGVTLALWGLAPRAALAAWGALAVCAVIGLFADLLDLPGWVQDLSPFQHVPAMPVDGFSLLPMLALTAVAGALVAVGIAGFRHRDTGAGV